MKKRIILRVQGDKTWIGGVYYKKNILYSMLQSEKIKTNYDIVVCVTPKYSNIFEEFNDEIILKVFPENKYFFELGIIKEMLSSNNKYMYCMNSSFFNKLWRGRSIYWIPDFQYKYYPDYFDKKLVDKRDNNYTKMAKTSGKLVLSSQACRDDYEKFFPVSKNQITVIPFVSYIEKEITNLSDDFCKSVLEKYNLSGHKYIYIPNQFWKHKNHIVVLEAIKKLSENNFSDYKFVFTGELLDFRNPDYIDLVKEKMSDPDLMNYIVNLGFIPRADQVAIMKEASFLIQPSLFEGWGTVMEDAKVLDKTVLLSNIPVHREQKSEKCYLFNPSDSDELSKLIKEVASKETEESISEGLKRMKDTALEYSKRLEELFDLA